MSKQQYFNNSLLHVTARDLSQTTGRPHWERSQPAYIAAMYSVESHAADPLVREIMRSNPVRGWSISELRDNSLRPLSVVSVIFYGYIRRVRRGWLIVGDCGSEFSVYPNSDILVVLSHVPEDEVVGRVASYARTHLHSTITYHTEHMETRTSELPSGLK